MSNKNHIPRPVFDTLDTLDEIKDQYKAIYDSDSPRETIRQLLNQCFITLNKSLPTYLSRDYQLALNFLYSYRGSSDTFRAYRRDIERLLQWSWFTKKSLF